MPYQNATTWGYTTTGSKTMYWVLLFPQTVTMTSQEITVLNMDNLKNNYREESTYL